MKEYRVVVHDNGDTSWFNLDGQVHREDGPALVTSNIKKWYLNGLLHRTDGPAVEYNNGTVEYWLEGVEIRKRLFVVLLKYVFNVEGQNYRLVKD